MTTCLTEDDLYRTSTQYRLWSFSPEQLVAQRRKTHALALARAQQHARPQNGDQAQTGDDAEYLSEEEELRLVQRYCDLIRTTSDHLKWPINIKATAVQYLKRFYLSNSCITYPPKEIYKTVLFLASKTEALHITVNKFASSISADPDTILAPEYKVMQALRFTLDVRQPFRGLKGVLMELLNMASGLVGATEASSNGEDIQHALIALPSPTKQCRTPWKPPPSTPTKTHAIDRIQAACPTSRTLLDAPASLTDVYFFYTPSQILLAAMHVADSALTAFYLDTKLPLTSPNRPKILSTIHDCAAVMAAFDPKSGMSKDERAALEKKLDACRDASAKDLVKNHATMKRNGDIGEQEAKRRKLEREKDRKEMDDLFGPSLGGGNGNRKG